MQDDIINSNDTDYVMKRIKELFLVDTTVTIILIGNCTRSRKFVDWEIQASLRKAANRYPNGLVVIQLDQSNVYYPNRLVLNIASGYSTVNLYPTNTLVLSNLIDESLQSRFRKNHLVVNLEEIL